MLNFIDTITDLKFMAIFIGLLVATFVAEWIVDLIDKRRKQ
jgi:hypothetical protein